MVNGYLGDYLSRPPSGNWIGDVIPKKEETISWQGSNFYYKENEDKINDEIALVNTLFYEFDTMDKAKRHLLENFSTQGLICIKETLENILNVRLKNLTDVAYQFSTWHCVIADKTHPAYNYIEKIASKRIQLEPLDKILFVR